MKDDNFDTLNFRDCFVSRLLSIEFWIVLGVSLALKQWCLLPRLEQYYKKTRTERTRERKRRLRDTLNDPVLAQQMEERLLKRSDIQGDRQKMLQVMQQRREMARDSATRIEIASCGDDDTNDDGEDAVKGQGKKEAASAIMKATICLSIALFCAIQGVSPDYSDFRYVYKDHTMGYTRLMKYDSCKDFGGFWFGPWLGCAMFCLIHFIHSYKMIPRPKKRRSTLVQNSENHNLPAGEAGQDIRIFPSNNNNDGLGTSSDMEQPLLPQEEETTEPLH